MSAQYIDGRAIAQEILDRLKREIETEHLDVGFAAILVGDDPASHIYIRLKERAAKDIGIRFERMHLEHGTSQETLEAAIKSLNARSDIHAVLLQLPLPKHLNADAAIRTIDPNKDVDGFHPKHTIEPVLSQAVVGLIDATGVDHHSHTATVICNSPSIFAPPLIAALEQRGIASRATEPDASGAIALAQSSDVLVVAIGRAHFITTEWVKPGATIIDIGINKKDGAVVGDVDPSVDAIAAWRTPVPGGVGPMTVACAMQNAVTLARRLRSLS